MQKYWKRPNGVCGTMGDNGHVPDSEEATKAEYDAFVASLPAVSDHKAEFAALLSADEKIDYIAKQLKLA